MNIIVALEYRFDRTPDGMVWTQTQFPYSFWQRYLEVFDHVQVVARVRNLPTVPSDCKEANGDHVSFTAIPYYIGPVQYLWRSLQVKRIAQQAVNPEDAVILRVSSTIASCIEPKLRATHHPYAVEVVADPYDVFAPGSIRHPLRPFFRWWSPQILRRQCANACAAAYVTKEALQTRYPCPHYSVGISDVDIPEEFLILTPRQFHQMKTLHLIFVGTLAQLYKAPHILLSAMAICIQKGIDLKLTMIGDGKHRTELEEQAAALGLKERVCFRGQLAAGKAVTTELDQADLFVLPSYQEGLPRAMVEAMARGLPCIGSTVGGIPELLPIEDMVTPGNVDALASKIQEVVTDPERMARMSARNLEKAKDYRDEVLREQRIGFYRYVRSQTEKWLLTQKT
ncbi:glycosyltransferase family 4 protein [Anabaena sp. UHCC 0253]|uniref:glycosyltransferase family 4 protein n=1 Tax=Anabaena sp. UHCC 0253 TaxID=2590019 RepID=UPI001445A877|nr:glycosyltransferase family 4 protein [Anabaena sp. UHCC 0253]MTJ55110.1 glycosyltransferase family 4 protein [Anabaena sp. UHCC 0253]